MKFFFVFVLVFVIISYLCTQLLEIRLSEVPAQSYWKKKAFAIISRIAKSVGNSIWYNKHRNNM